MSDTTGAVKAKTPGTGRKAGSKRPRSDTTAAASGRPKTAGPAGRVKKTPAKAKTLTLIDALAEEEGADAEGGSDEDGDGDGGMPTFSDSEFIDDTEEGAQDGETGDLPQEGAPPAISLGQDDDELEGDLGSPAPPRKRLKSKAASASASTAPPTADAHQVPVTANATSARSKGKQREVAPATVTTDGSEDADADGDANAAADINARRDSLMDATRLSESLFPPGMVTVPEMSDMPELPELPDNMSDHSIVSDGDRLPSSPIGAGGDGGVVRKVYDFGAPEPLLLPQAPPVPGQSPRRHRLR